jgi:coiled-coil domain-containing protein 12
MTDRKARLAALAAKAGRSKAAEEVPKVRFRNYAPHDASLEDEGEPLTEEAPTAKKPKLLQQALEEAQQEVATTTLVNTHPTNVVKKINWDLKRDIQPQLDRLERRTQLCIVNLLKERLAQEAQADDLD